MIEVGAGPHPRPLTEMSLLDLGEDVLSLVLLFAAHHQAFAALVCRLFRRLLVDQQGLCEARRVALSSIFASLSCLQFFLEDSKALRACAEVWGSRPLRVTEWKPHVKNLAFREASIDVLVGAKPELMGCLLTMDSYRASQMIQRAAASGRADLLERMFVTAGSCSCILRAIVACFKVAAADTGATWNSISKKHCSTFVAPACQAPNPKSLEWFVEKLGPAATSKSSNWARLFSRFEGNVRFLLTTASGSVGAFGILQFLAAHMQQHGDKQEARPVAIAVVAASSVKRAGAWAWLREQCAPKTLEERLLEFKNCKAFSAMRLSVVYSEFMKLDSFKVRDLESYLIVRDGVGAGGWLQSVFVHVAGSNVQLPMLTSAALVKEMQNWFSTSFVPRRETPAIMAECVRDMVLYGQTGHRRFKIAFYKLTERFPLEAYLTAKRLAADGAPQPQLLYIALQECVLSGMSRVAADAVANRDALGVDKIHQSDLSVLLDAVLTQTKRKSLDIRVLKDFVAFCRVGVHHVVEALRYDQTTDATELLRHCSQEQKVEIGKELVTACCPSSSSLRVALESGCFESGSVFEEDVRRTLERDVEEPPRKRPRFPFASLKRAAMSVRFRM